MPTLQHILFPVDFSDRSRAVRPFVQAMANAFNARVTLMHVGQLPTETYGVQAAWPALFDLTAMRADAQEKLTAFFESPTPNFKMETIAEQGDPAIYIASYSEQNDVDMIMMPTHGYGKFRNLLLGSVTAKVLHDAKCPVWTSTHTEDPDLIHHLRCKNILCAVDLSAVSGALIRYGAELADRFKAELRLVHAVSEADSYPEQGFGRFLREAAHEALAKLQQQSGTNFEAYIEAGAISDVVRAQAMHHDADLVVIGRGSIQELLGRLRTNAYAIIRNSPCPVLSV
ncbi:MAG: universal stress protein [Acidobacteriota bacterium]|nr:universal stress protein [Acidobacteriota bacterium]